MDNTLIDKIIHCLHKLTRKNDAILRVWQRVARLKLKESIEKQVFLVEHQELLLHLDTESQDHVITRLYKKIVRPNDFNDGDYFKTLDIIDRSIAQNKLACDFTSSIGTGTVEPNTFIDYIQATSATDTAYRDNATTKAYKCYQVATSSKVLDNYLINLLPDNFDHADIAETLRDNSTYTFPTLLQAITNCIDGQNVNKDNIGAIFITYRLLVSNEEKPLPVTLNSTHINQLHSELEIDGQNIKESGCYDLIAMWLTHGHSVSLVEGGDIKYVAELMDYYVNRGDLLVNSMGWNIPLLNETLQYMVNYKLGYRLLLLDILPQLEDIKNRMGVTDKVFAEHLAEWNADLDKYTTKNSVKGVIPDTSFHDLATKISNVLAGYINRIAFKALSKIGVDTLYTQRTVRTPYYWFVAIRHLLAKVKSLPDNLTEFDKKILMDIASGTQSLSPFPNCFKNIVERLGRRKIRSTVIDIRNNFCIGKETINAIKFQFFETWLRSHGNLKGRAGDVIDKIVKPVISDGAYRSLILQNKDSYMNLINTAGDGAYELRGSPRDLIQEDSDP